MSQILPDGGRERIELDAAAWVLRCDRGLTPREQDAFSEWLAADPRHGQQLSRHRQHWRRLDGLVEWRPEHSARPNPDLLAPSLRRRVLRFVPAATLLATAAGVMLVWMLGDAPAPGKKRESAAAQTSTAGPATAAAAPNQRVLPDGTIVELNDGAEITVHYTPGERRVTLERGEAHFAVKTNLAWPFIVRAQGVDVRAVGTAFNVRVEAHAIEVLVTEGRVQLETQRPAGAATSADAAPPGPAILEARQRAVVSRATEMVAPQIATLTDGEIERVLAWQHRLLDLTAAPLNQIVAEFNRRNVVQLVIIDPELASLRVSGALRSDNIAGFVLLIETSFGARAERRGATEILLRKVK